MIYKIDITSEQYELIQDIFREGISSLLLSTLKFQLLMHDQAGFKEMNDQMIDEAEKFLKYLKQETTAQYKEKIK